MKKLLALVLIVCLVFTVVLAGCTSISEAPKDIVGDRDKLISDDKNAGDEDNNDGTVDDENTNEIEDSNNTNNIENDQVDSSSEVDKNLDIVEITYPKDFVSGNSDFELGKEGIIDIKDNEDGTVTVTIVKEIYESMLDEAKSLCKDFLDSLPNNEEYPSIKEIEYSEDFDEIVIRVNKEAYEENGDSIVVLGILMSTGFYKQLNNESEPEISIEIRNIEDDSLIDSVKIPE